MTYYMFNHRILRKGFCKHCGVQIVNELVPMTGKIKGKEKKATSLLTSSTTCDEGTGRVETDDVFTPTDDQIAALDGVPKIIYGFLANKKNINLRTLDDFDCSKLELFKADGRNDIPSDWANP